MTDQFDQLFPTLNPITASGIIRQCPEDFKVFEYNEINWTEQGEHWWLYVEKINANTAWTATQLASACKVPARQVGYAGLKDRNAVTRQWFSVQLPKVCDLAAVQDKLPPGITIIEDHWHQSKLKTGHLQHNQFELIIRAVQGNRNGISTNITTIQQQGVPNYFGAQRFGHQMNNIDQATAWFNNDIRVNNKNKRGLLISSARSHIFNLITAHRIKQGLWGEVIPGDLLQLNGSHSWFPAIEATSEELNSRLNGFDIHITAALWGEDPVQSTDTCAELENNMADQFPAYHKGFEQHRVKQDRRAMRVRPINLSHQWVDDDLKLTFSLPPGAYATCVMREILSVSDHKQSTP